MLFYNLALPAKHSGCISKSGTQQYTVMHGPSHSFSVIVAIDANIVIMKSADTATPGIQYDINGNRCVHWDQ